MSRIFTAWKARYFDREKQRSKNSLDIYGERGCGKTAAAQAYVRAHKNKARYFSFADLEGAAALMAFAAAFQLEKKNPASWDEAGQLFPDYSRPDVLLLFSMTGGILAILYELDEHAGLEENLRTLLRYDSAFSRFLPEWLRDRKSVTYHLTNSYIAAWCLFVYRRRSQQIADPDGLLRKVMDEIDVKLALPAFYRSCFRYLEMSTKEYLIPYRYPSSTELKTDVPFRFKDGYTLKLNYCVQIDSQTLIAIPPDSYPRESRSVSLLIPFI